MVLIFKKQRGRLITLVFLHKQPLFVFLIKHVRRRGLYADRPNTCLVTREKSWEGYPRDTEAVEILNKIIQSENIREGFDIKYPARRYIENHQAFREFDGNNTPLNPPTNDGIFKSTITRVNPGANAVLTYLDRFEINPKGIIEKIRNSIEERKIRNTFKKIQKQIANGEADKVIVYVIDHIHITI